MGSSPPAPKEMAAAQALVTVLWAASLFSCAAQGINQNKVVSDVVVALQPSIARAVADALAGLNSRSVSTSSIGSSSTGSRGSISTASRGSLTSLSSSLSSSRGASDIATAGPTARPVYNFQYKVADDGEQSYISQEEARDGDDLSGTYSYVDANGALVTVNYESGAMGYSETRDLQEGFVQMRARPVWTGALAVDNGAAVTAARDQATQEAQAAQAAEAAQAAQAARRAESARLAAARQESARLEAARQEAARLEAARLTASRQSSSINQNSIISQVISSLQPLISRTVQGVITSSSSGSSAVSSSSSSSSSGSVIESGEGSGDLASTFGDGGLAVSVETPDFQFAF